MLIPNRGDTALRVVRTCRQLGIRCVVGYSVADRDTLPVRLADEAVCLGPADPVHSYMSVPSILYACARAGVDAVHPGIGFLAEDAAFARACADLGLVFVGPGADHLALLGDKIATRRRLRAAGLPVLPGSDGAVSSVTEAVACAETVGYPVVVKAAAGGGGRGIEVARDAARLTEAWSRVRRQARLLFHDQRVLIERYVAAARHVEVQVVADGFGSVVHLGERDCSVQRHHQKLLEEAPSPCLSSASRSALCEAAVRGARSIGLRNVSTFEFLVDAEDDFHLIEVNPRLQVEHPVTESVTGLDIVELMIRMAACERLSITQDAVAVNGHAIEARVNAEDPSSGWSGSAGKITKLVLPGGPGIRVDSHLVDGCEVPPHYDSLIAKIIAMGPDRGTAVRRLLQALREITCDGLRTNVDFLDTVVAGDRFRTGTHDTGLVETILHEGTFSSNTNT
ncbi:acetyl/propionyl/methylcrotonyl-CoA carboxylase subunit alpha [Spirillospora sp. NPDC048911]|uniref:acetyl-CoA carboxylase biotin carboxylase subunit n=1 Tax=Spirillospora sp. NPDC048911 TaxID=3364527 RepID=UPI00371B172C